MRGNSPRRGNPNASRLDFRRLAGAPARVLRPYAEWQLYEQQRAEKGGVDWYTVEGPFVVRQAGRCVCFYSGGRWQAPNYGVGYLLADRPMGEGGLEDQTWTDPVNAAGPTVLAPGPAP